MSRVRDVLAGVWLLGLLAHPAFAQDPKVGIEIGANLAYLTVPPNHPTEGHNAGLGLMAGVFAVLPVTTTVSIQPEIQYSQRHSSVLLGIGTPTARTVSSTLDYASVAVLARLKFYGPIYLTEGPAFHFPLRAKWGDTDIKDIAHIDMSLVIGVGVKMHGIYVEGRWDSSLRLTQKEWLPPNQPFTRNRAITGLIAIPLK